MNEFDNVRQQFDDTDESLRMLRLQSSVFDVERPHSYLIYWIVNVVYGTESTFLRLMMFGHFKKSAL